MKTYLPYLFLQPMIEDRSYEDSLVIVGLILLGCTFIGLFLFFFFSNKKKNTEDEVPLSDAQHKESSAPLTENESPFIENDKEKSTHKKITLIAAIGISIFVIISFILIPLSANKPEITITGNYQGNNNTHSPQLFSRKATVNDLEIESQYKFPVSIDIVLRPYADINNLQLTITHYDKNGKLLETQIKTIGNVLEGGEYTTQLDITDFSLSTIWSIEKTSYQVTQGTVSYFQ